MTGTFREDLRTFYCCRRHYIANFEWNGIRL